ncbi:MAG: hypothetical protein AAB217_08750, partial [Chloroflexota bacterium]
ITTHILEIISIPSYDPSNPTHMQLSMLSRRAHASTNLPIELVEIEHEIDEAAAELWGLTSAELTEIKRSLEELG